MKTVAYLTLCFTLLLSGCDYEYILIYQLENKTGEAIQVTSRYTSLDELETVEIAANSCQSFLSTELIGKRKRSFADSDEETILVDEIEIFQDSLPYIGNEKEFDRWVITDRKGQSTFVITVTADDF